MRRSTELAGVALMLLLIAALGMPDRLRRAVRDERGDGGGKGVIILVATVLGIVAVVAVAALITSEINKRGPGLGE